MVDINSSNVVDDNTVDAADGTFCSIYLLLFVLIIIYFVAVVTRRRKRKRKSVHVEDSGSSEEFDIENPPWNNDTENTNSNTNKRSNREKSKWAGKGRGGNNCNLNDNGPGGVNHLSTVNATVAMGVASASSASDDNIGPEYEEVGNRDWMNRDYFEGTGFLTSSKVKITEEKVRAMMVHDEGEKAVPQLFEEHMPITCSIDDSPEYKAMSGIIFSLLQSGDIEPLDAGSTSSTSPKFNRSSLNIYGAHRKIVDAFPSGYSVAKTARGKSVLDRLGHAIVDTDVRVGARSDQGHVYALLWKGVPLIGSNAGVAIGDHADGNSRNDNTCFTARDVHAFGPDFKLNLTLYVMWLDDDGTKHQQKIRTVSRDMKGNHTYILSHIGSGRGAIAQTTWNGKAAVLVIMHSVSVPKEDMKSPRVALMRDHVFESKEAHDGYLLMMSSGRGKHSRSNEMVKLGKTLQKENAAMKDYVKDLYSNVPKTLSEMTPCSMDFSPLCSGENCSNKACALNLQEIEGKDSGESGNELYASLRGDGYSKDKIEHRLLCEDCAAGVATKDLVILNLCMSCWVNPKLAKLAYCGGCRKYQCRGYDDVDGERKFACVQDGVMLNESNISQSQIGRGNGAICNVCYRYNLKKKTAKASETSKKARDDDAGGDYDEIRREEMRAIYQLYDPVCRTKVHAKYIRGSKQISWKNACDEKDGYKALAGGSQKIFESFYKNFRAKAGAKIDTLAKLEEYIRKGGKFGVANSGSNYQR